MMSYVESNQRYGIIEAVIHLVNRDFRSLAALYQRLGFIPRDVDTKPIVVALEQALPEVLNASVGELNFKNVVNKLGDVMYKFPFSLPPYYIAIIRCLGVLEGLAIQVRPESRIIQDAYPYIASRLLTDSSPELQDALQQLIFKKGKPRYGEEDRRRMAPNLQKGAQNRFTPRHVTNNPDPALSPRHNRWERLEELLEVAGATSDYDVTLAMDQLLDYVLSDQGSEFRRIFAAELVDAVDRLGADTTSYVLRNWRALAQGTPLGPVVAPPTVGLAGVGGVVHDPGMFCVHV